MKRWLARRFLRLTGWALETGVPAGPRYVLIAAPHTSNWDFVYFLALAWSADVDLHWMGKSSLFFGPLGPLFRALGGIPIRRDRRSNVVAATVEAFRERERLIITIPPEGTRGRRETWKSGFWHIARLAGVPIVPGYLDFARKLGGLGPALDASNDVRADMDRIRAFYADKAGLYPELFTPPRLKEESAD